MRACRLHVASGVHAEIATALRFLVVDLDSKAALRGELGIDRPSDERRVLKCTCVDQVR